MQEKANKPALRFKGFDEDWEQRKLKDISQRITRKNTHLESTLPLTISATLGLVDQNIYFQKRIASRDVSNYYLIKKESLHIIKVIQMAFHLEQ